MERNTCKCETCGAEFLNVDRDVFLKHHLEVPAEKQRQVEAIMMGAKAKFDMKTIPKLDKWYLSAMQHYIENPEHHIVFCSPVQELDLFKDVDIYRRILGKDILNGLRELVKRCYLEEAVI